MTSFKPKVGDRVAHKNWPSFGVGIVTEMLKSDLPSLPAKRCRVQFNGVTRPCFVEDLCEPEHMRFGGHQTRLVASDGDLVA